MGNFLRVLLRPILRPLTRLLLGVIAIPLFRLFLKKVIRLQDLNEELEKDFEQWFRGSLLLLVATRNMEEELFAWVPPDLLGEEQWITMGFRVLLAIGVVEAMPDQELFAIIHPGPPKLNWSRERGYLCEFREQFWPVCRGILCQHLNRSSPVFAIMAAIVPGRLGWICFGLAIVQYLIIGLVTSRDKALDALTAFDKQVALRRREIIEEFDIRERDWEAKNSADLTNSTESGNTTNCPDEGPRRKSPDTSVVKQQNAGYVEEQKE